MAELCAEWHQTNAQAFHEKHQADDDRQQPTHDDHGVLDQLAKYQDLEQRQVGRQGYHGLELVHQAGGDKRLQQTPLFAWLEARPCYRCGDTIALGIELRLRIEVIEVDLEHAAGAPSLLHISKAIFTGHPDSMIEAADQASSYCFRTVYRMLVSGLLSSSVFTG